MHKLRYENALLRNFRTSGLASYLSTRVFKGPRELKFSPALSKVSKIHELCDKYKVMGNDLLITKYKKTNWQIRKKDMRLRSQILTSSKH